MIWRITTLVLTGLLGGYVGWAIADRDVPFAYWDQHPLNEPVAGGELLVEYKVKRTRPCGVIAHRLVIDNQGTVLVVPPSINFLPGLLPTDEEKLVVSIPVPITANPGPAIYRMTRAFTCNWLQTVLEWPILDGPHDMRFIVRPPPDISK